MNIKQEKILQALINECKKVPNPTEDFGYAVVMAETMLIQLQEQRKEKNKREKNKRLLKKVAGSEAKFAKSLKNVSILNIPFTKSNILQMHKYKNKIQNLFTVECEGQLINAINKNRDLLTIGKDGKLDITKEDS